jgi:hypothetical protein
MDEALARLWDNLMGRIGGPMTFRLILQPAMALFFGIRDGLKDARAGRSPHLWTIFTDPTERRVRLRETWEAVARVFVLALVIDAVYQYVALRWFYPGEALTVAFVLALVPYVLIRGPVNRIARRWSGDAADPRRAP